MGTKQNNLSPGLQGPPYTSYLCQISSNPLMSKRFLFTLSASCKSYGILMQDTKTSLQTGLLRCGLDSPAAKYKGVVLTMEQLIGV